MPCSQNCSSPASHCAQARQESTKQPTPTASPTLNRVTSTPTSATLSTLQGLGVSKGFDPAYVAPNVVSRLKIRLANTFDPNITNPVVRDLIDDTRQAQGIASSLLTFGG